MNKFSKQLYLATLALTLVTNLASSESTTTTSPVAEVLDTVKQDTSTPQQLDVPPIVVRDIHHPSIFYSDGIEVGYFKSIDALPANLRFQDNPKMNRLLEKAMLEAGLEGFVYLLKQNDTGLYQLIYGNSRQNASSTDLKLDGAEAQIFSEGQVNMKEVYQSPLIQRIFAELKSADPMAIKAQVEALPYVRGEAQRAIIAGRALQNFEMMEQAKNDDYSSLYTKQEIEAIKRLLTKLKGFKPLDEQDNQELNKLGNDLDQSDKGDSKIS